MIISHKHKFIFICNGKMGTSSIEAALGAEQEGEEYEIGVSGLYHKKHVPPAVVRAQLGPEVWDRYFTFCFVRNPWDWFVSQHFWNQKPAPVSKRKLVQQPVQLLLDYRAKQEKEAELRSLETLAPSDIHDTYEMLRQYRGRYEAESLFQHVYTHDASGNQIVDFIGRFERLGEDFEQILDHINVDAELPHVNATRHRDYRSYFTPETTDLVAELYQEDIERFGYETDRPT